jgi:hypothetical protein
MELRYLTRVRVIPGVPPQIDDCDERVLQYRTMEPYAADPSKWDWTEWTDVPEVKLTETGE